MRDDIHEHNDDEGEDLVTVAVTGANHLVTEAVTDEGVEEGGMMVSMHLHMMRMRGVPGNCSSFYQ